MSKPTNFWQAIRTSHKRYHQAPTITPMSRNGAIPLSWAQERLWAVDQMNPDGAMHNLRSVFRLDGPLDVTALTHSLQEIINRHETLRTTFPTVNGQPVQQIAPTLTLPLPVVNLSQADPEPALKRLAVKFAQQPFDLATGPLMRLKLLRLSETAHVLLRTIHHIISDRWSDSVFMKELARFYESFGPGEPAPLSALPIQYADFVLFERQWLTADRLAAQRAYWQKQLQGDVQPARLPVSFNPPPGPTYQGNVLYLELPAALTASLKRLSRQEGISLFVIVLAAFKTLLFQYSGQTDIIVCSPLAGRHQPETKNLIGYFNKLVLLRSSLTPDLTFHQLLRHISQATLGAFENQDIPVQHIADACNIPGAVLSRVMVALQNTPALPTKMGDVTLTQLDLEDGISNFDLSLSLKMKKQQLMGVWRYKTDLFEPARLEQLSANFQTLLETIAARSTTPLSDLPDLTAATPIIVQTEAPYVPSQTAMEQTVTGVWRKVLQRDRISVQANFFDIGGRSLTMMKIAVQLQETLERTIPLVELFKRPTIKEMAAYLDQESLTPTINTRQIRDRTQRQRDALKRRKRQYKKSRS